MSSIYDFDISMLGTKGDLAGIGSRAVCKNRSFIMFKAGFAMALSGYHLRSGAADGSDTAFEYGYRCAIAFLSQYIELPIDIQERMMTIFLPWKGFSGRESGNGITCFLNENSEDLSSKYHQGWIYLSSQERLLMARNAMQVLGICLSKRAKFIIADTDDGAFNLSSTTSRTGGTGQAIRIACDYNIPVFNLSHPEHSSRIESWITKVEAEMLDKYGIDAGSFANNWYHNHIGIEDWLEGDLISMAKRGEVDVLVHGCNIFNVKGSGFAKSLFEAFPEAYSADQKTSKGSSRKLGTYTSVDVIVNGRKMTIINAYIQKTYGRDPNVLYSDYKAIRKVFKAISRDFKRRSVTVPQIGSGLANGCWITISNIIKSEMKYTVPPKLVLYRGAQAYADEKLSMRDYVFQLEHNDQFVLFFGQEDPFSNWHYSLIVEDGIKFNNIEQYMMYHKALLMGDTGRAFEVLNVKNGDPKECKRIGRLICSDVPGLSWDEAKWIESREDIVLKGSILKYSQNPYLLQPLLHSGNRTMVEASKYDAIWGVKMGASNKNIFNRNKWKGLNLLGKVLELARDHIKSNPAILCPVGQRLLSEAIELNLFNVGGKGKQIMLI
ncbi:NADAR domain-containing protein [Psychromonas sp. SP041]|uniref:NADAR domain-containing protein n=1 Tax=Psychromonas sp. SP041 TaxID=1365007 RepID=UPI001485B81F|nr:NADAR domain-containing protein [Psychromonas sp. SP041]